MGQPVLLTRATEERTSELESLMLTSLTSSTWEKTGTVVIFRNLEF